MGSKRTNYSSIARKRARKLANKAIFEERKRTGINTKSARAKKSLSREARKKRLVSHPEGPCGNIGCKRCDPCGIHHRK